MLINYGFHIEKTGKKIKHALQQVFNRLGYDLTVDQWVLLYEMHQNGAQKQNVLAQKTNKDAPTVTRIIDLLEKKGWVQRSTHTTDRRSQEVSLTDEGKRLVEELLPIVEDFRKSGIGGLNETDLHQMKQVLDRIYENFSNG